MNRLDSPPELALFLSQLPTDPGIYQMLNHQSDVLYVGKATNLKKRVTSYFNKQVTGVKTRSLVSQIASIRITVTRSETEALLLESNLIKSLRPKYNILLRDDKSYPYIHFSAHPEFPRIESYRSKKKPVVGQFFGPYPSGLAVRETITLIQKVFKLRPCRDSYFNARSRPCLQYQIKRCNAPCVGFVRPEDYQQSVTDAIHLLQGKSQLIIDELSLRMTKAVDALHFEEAAVLRDQIKSVRLVQEQQGVVSLRGDADVIVIESSPGFACIQCVSIREGQVLSSTSFFPVVPELGFSDLSVDELWEQTFSAFIGFHYLDHPEIIPAFLITHHAIKHKKALENALTQQRGTSCTIQTAPRGIKARWIDFAENNLRVAVAEYVNKHTTIRSRYDALESFLPLNKKIERMECFDISHMQGEATVASCVVFDSEGPKPSEYRRFNITGITPGDDYAAMEQALLRRFKRLIESNSLPDVLIIDGGKGQVTRATRVLAALNCTGVFILGVAKGAERKAGWERFLFADEAKEFTLPDDSKASHLLQHIRNEAHRFAITAHRKKRDKTRLTSSLESIEGIGAKRRNALLQRFGGLRELSKASLDELSKVSGISASLAARIHQYFHD